MIPSCPRSGSIFVPLTSGSSAAGTLMMKIGSYKAARPKPMSGSTINYYETADPDIPLLHVVPDEKHHRDVANISSTSHLALTIKLPLDMMYFLGFKRIYYKATLSLAVHLYIINLW